MISDYLRKLQSIKNGTLAPDPKKQPKEIPKQSEKMKAKIKEEKKVDNGDDKIKEKWFKARRKELTGTCQCGCARPSSKFDDDNFRCSCCHIFPQRLFPSVQFHPVNCIERNFWDGCHTNMDNQSMDKWPLFADWEDIKERFYILAPLLTDEERATKFYSTLEKLVYPSPIILLSGDNINGRDVVIGEEVK